MVVTRLVKPPDRRCQMDRMMVVCSRYHRYIYECSKTMMSCVKYRIYQCSVGKLKLSVYISLTLVEMCTHKNMSL